MPAQRAIILAAGNGKRMGSLTTDRPKAMLNVNGRTLIDRQLSALHYHDIYDITIVSGYQHDRLKAHVGRRARFIENRDYATTNSLYSLSLARTVIEDGAIIMNSDILVSAELLGCLIDAPSDDAVLVERRDTFGDEEMKVAIWNDFAVKFGKDLPPEEAHAENVGIVKLGPTGGELLLEDIDRLLGAGEINAWAPKAFDALAKHWPLLAVETCGVPWTEIDFPEDLARAEQEIAPALAGLPVAAGVGA
jgi:choline kinase